MTTGRVTFFPFYPIIALMSYRMADRKTDESVEGLMANPIKEVVTVFKCNYYISAKIISSGFKKCSGLFSGLKPGCDSNTVI